IFSILTCCCGWGGIVLGAIALILANKDLKLYRENPDVYLNYNNLNTGRILAMVGITLSSLIFLLYMYVGEDKIKEFQQNLKDKMEHMEQNQ
ncbi:MAG: CCC motif membrane protein, partial [Flavobacterium sp.]